ncbi:hypothetical protein [Endozoicomonas sp. SCSIO W0465]|uniref:hypothetical protein n=1 Tax=Endozoicomonas sp. SCSIO W0465 TaxID=2918516 RepID=UPI0020763801|nr:hypothetical protein [Endozoicomonas sp. SCSIO W0465]USE36439.1 hypothetical protein MJO57_31230 [Endozoicomonas sp. SCSIO W0465]
MDLKTQYQQSIKFEKEYSIFFLETSQPGWGSILEEHHNRQMPFIMDGDGFMLFASGEAKSLYDGLDDAIRAGIRHNPESLKLHAPSCLKSATVVGTECQTEVPSSIPSSFAGISEFDLLSHYHRGISNIETLEQLRDELQSRSSSGSGLLKQMVDIRLADLHARENTKKAAAIQEPEETSESIAEQKPSRPFLNKTIQDLEELYWQAFQNRGTLQQLYKELQCRSSVKSIRLCERVRKRLNSMPDVEFEKGAVTPEVTKPSGAAAEYQKTKTRPYIDRTALQLKTLHLSGDSGLDVQQAILAELEFRFTTEAIRLKALVCHKIEALRSTAQTTDEQADSESQRKLEEQALLATYKKRLLEGRAPTQGQLAAFYNLDSAAKADFLAKVELEKQRLIQQEENNITCDDRDEEEAEYELSTPKPTMVDLLTKRANVFELAKKVKEQASALKFSFSSASRTVESKSYDRGNSLDDDYIAEDSPEDYPPPVLEEPVKPLELVADFTRPYARVQAMIQKELDRQDFQILLKLSVQDRRLNDVGNELGMSRRDVKRRVTELVERIGEQYAEPLKAFAEPMDALLDEEGDEVLLEQAAEKLGLTLARMKFLVMVAGSHFRQPCKIHQDRAYRPTRLLD